MNSAFSAALRIEFPQQLANPVKGILGQFPLQALATMFGNSEDLVVTAAIEGETDSRRSALFPAIHYR